MTPYTTAERKALNAKVREYRERTQKLGWAPARIEKGVAVLFPYYYKTPKQCKSTKN
jgi:hypothetical protein